MPNERTSTNVAPKTRDRTCLTLIDFLMDRSFFSLPNLTDALLSNLDLIYDNFCDYSPINFECKTSENV